METEGRQAQSGAALVFARKPHQDRGTRRQEHRTAWLWFHYLCPQIWGGATSRIDSRETLPDVNHVEGGNVLHRDREYGHRRRERRRFQTRWRKLAAVFLLSLTALCGCLRADLSAVYFEANSNYQSGDSDSALKLVETGLQHAG